MRPSSPTLSFCPALGALLLALLPLAARAAEPALAVTAPGKTITFTLAEFQALPHVEVDAFDAHEKKTHRYSGVPVRALLTQAGVPSGEAVRGPVLREAVVSHAADGYAIIFALAEFDEAFSDRTILLVDREDGQPLPDGAGPLRIIAPGDKRPARWARMVKSLEVVAVPAGR
jgi:hypothetical protein